VDKHSKPTSQVLALSDTQYFTNQPRKVFIANLNLIPAIQKALNWSKCSADFFSDILRICGDSSENVIRLYHSQFAKLLWPNDDPKIAAQRITNKLRKLNIDMQLSGFRAAKVLSGYRREINGQVESRPTAYQILKYWELDSAIRKKVEKSDLFSIQDNNLRNKELLKIVRQVCKEFGYKPVPPGAHKEQRPAVEDSHQDRIEKLRRQPNEESWNDWLNRTAEEYAHKLSETGGVEKRSRIKQMLNMVEMVEVRDRDITERAAANGNGHKQIKLNGGQPR
jgi:hypothetical protein